MQRRSREIRWENAAEIKGDCTSCGKRKSMVNSGEIKGDLREMHLVLDAEVDGKCRGDDERFKGDCTSCGTRKSE